mgnify:FL=1
MGNVYSSKYKGVGNPKSWYAYSSSGSTLQTYATNNIAGFSYTRPPNTNTTNTDSTASQSSDTSAYITSFTSSFNANTTALSSHSLDSGRGEGYQTVVGNGVEANPGTTYSYPQNTSYRQGSTTSHDDTGSYYTFSSIQFPLTAEAQTTSTDTNGSTTYLTTITNSLYQTAETTSVDETTKWKTEETDASSNFSTGAAPETYEGTTNVCSSVTKSTNESDTVSSKFASVSQSLELTSYSDSSSTNESFSWRSASTITFAGACRTNCLLAIEYYLDTNEVFTVSSDAVGNALASSQISTTRSTGPVSYAISQTMGASVLAVVKGYIDASVTDSSASYTTRTIGETSEIPYAAYTLDSNSSIVTTNLTHSYGSTFERLDLTHAPVYTLTGTTANPITTTCASVFPYYLTYTSDTETVGSLVGYMSQEQTRIITGSAESTTMSYTSGLVGTSNNLSLFTTTTVTVGDTSNIVTTFISTLTDVLNLSYSTDGTFTSLNSDSSAVSTYLSLSSTFASEYNRNSNGQTVIASSEGRTNYYRLDTIKSVLAYPSPIAGVLDFVPVMSPGTMAFGGFDETDSHTSNLGYHSVTLVTDGETFADYGDSFITDNLVSKNIGYGAYLLPTGKCFNIPSATSATYQWMTSSDWPKSGTSSQLSARFASTSSYTTSGGVLGNTSVQTKTSTEYKSLTVSLSLTSAVEEASAKNNFVRYDEQYGVSLRRLNNVVDVGYGINHKDNLDRSRQIHFPAGHYSISAYGDNQGTSVISEYTTQSTAAWLQSINDNERSRISVEPLYYIATNQAFAGNAALGVGIISLNQPYEDSKYSDVN